MADENKNAEPNDIGKELVTSFHEQFAQNQNHHQNLFIQTLAILLSVLIGYGYLYIRVGAPKPELNITIESLNSYLIIAMFLLSISIYLLSNMALGFRRDQLMAANIRVKSGVMTKDNNDNYFFGSFNPQGKTTFIFWMPEFHIIFYFGLIAVKVLLLMITLGMEKNTTIEFCDPPLFLICSIVFFILDILATYYYWGKWVGHSEKAPERLKN